MIATVQNQPNSRPPLLVMVIGISLLLYFSLIIIPFFAYGLHLQPSSAVAGGGFDPKDLPLYQGSIGALLRVLGIIGLLALPLIAVFAPILALPKLIHRPLALLRHRSVIIALLVYAVALLFYFSQYGWVIRQWYLD
ncbi:MAG: hypothetical protein KF726_13565 [Anaerolineae bacterium]|nr:hypothetical protein [Anaerolineae bacterium]